jgi:hypothetical protein
MAHGLILGVYTNLEFAKNMILESYPKKTTDHPKQGRDLEELEVVLC